jgi:hypothetical protein
MSYNKLGFTSGQTLKAEHLNHMEEGIEAIANNVQIKKAVFVDRQSVWNFLQQNHERTIFIGAKMTGYPFRIKFIPQTMSYNVADPNRGVDAFTLIEVNMFLCNDTVTNLPTIVPSCIQIDANTTHYLFDPKLGIDNNDVTVVTASSVQELPDAYWSVMNVELTAYYFSE